ncbi:MAG: hypothetical protein ACXVB9_10530 [Bdellovibrionota bacterium]
MRFRNLAVLCGWLVALGTVAAPAVSFAKLGGGPEAGDEDPFPLMCADFSGAWRADNGDRYNIAQRQCSFIKIQMTYSSEQSETMTIVPDNRTRPGPSKGSQIRHRWNSPKNATVLETHRIYLLDQGNTRVTEVTMFEQASDDLLLETTYRTTEFLDAPGQPPQHDYFQQVFRRTHQQAQEDQSNEPYRPIKKKKSR